MVVIAGEGASPGECRANVPDSIATSVGFGRTLRRYWPTGAAPSSYAGGGARKPIHRAGRPGVARAAAGDARDNRRAARGRRGRGPCDRGRGAGGGRQDRPAGDARRGSAGTRDRRHRAGLGDRARVRFRRRPPTPRAAGRERRGRCDLLRGGGACPTPVRASGWRSWRRCQLPADARSALALRESERALAADPLRRRRTVGRRGLAALPRLPRRPRRRAAGADRPLPAQRRTG